MAKETFTGPVIALGGWAGGLGVATPAQYGGVLAGGPREYSDEIGPSIFWGGTAIPGPGFGGSKDKTGPGALAAVYCASPIRTVNSANAVGASALTNGGNATSGVPFVNITTSALGLAVGTPVNIGGLTATGVALDMGLDPCGTNVSGAVTLATAANAWRYRVGQWICLLLCPANSTQMTQITAINAGVLTVSPVPAATIATGATGPQITLTNRYNPNAYGASQTPPTSVSSMASAGSARIMIPELGTTRGVGITGVASGTGGQVLIQGIGGFGAPQSEIITVGAGINTVWGKKTYDVFLSATPLFTDAHGYTVKTSDFFGLPLAVLSLDSIVGATFGGAALVFTGTTTAVVIPADLTYPATTTTGDPRGGIQLTANGPVTGPTGTTVTLNGATLLAIDQRLNPLQVALATTINPGPLLGVPSV